MEYRPYRQLSVSLLGYGAGHIGGEMDENEAGSLLNRILDSGINLIDTARGYGLSEERVGRHLSWRRDDFVLSTKVGYGIDGIPDWTGPCIRAGVDRALSVMRTDRIDIVHLHSCPRAVLERGEVIEALLDCRKQGKVRYAAYSGDNDDLVHAAGCGLFDGFEASFNVCDQRALGTVLAQGGSPEGGPAAAPGFIAKRPVANAPWRFSERPVGHYCEDYWVRWQEMALPDFGIEPSALALRFAAFTPGVSSCIAGSTNFAHIKENIDAIERGPLPPGVRERILAAFSAHGAAWDSRV